MSPVLGSTLPLCFTAAAASNLSPFPFDLCPHLTPQGGSKSIRAATAHFRGVSYKLALAEGTCTYFYKD